ncbi:unnamed protein product [Urochloa humidicola]
MAAAKGEMAAEETGDMAVKTADEEKGATEERKGASAVEKGEKGAASADEDKGATAEGKRNVSEEAAAVLKLSEEAEWKWKIGTAANEEDEPNPRRERRRWRSTRKDSGAAAEKEEEVTAAAEKEVAGEKRIFFFSAVASGKKIDPASSESEGKLSEAAVLKLSEEAEWKWKIATPGDGEEAPKPRRERRRWRWRSARRAAAAADMEEATAAAKEVAGEKPIFFFSAAAAGKVISVVSSEGTPFKMSEAAARMSVVLADIIDDGCAGGIIPLPNVDARALSTVIKYCDKHAAAATAKPNSGAGSSSSVDAAAPEKTLAEWDRKLVDDLTKDALYDLIGAANFLNIKGLLDATCQKVADMIKGKTAEQIRSIFDITHDFTADEEAEMRKESPWAFDD